MNFSLILPSRGRPHMLSNLCRSIHANTKHLSQIEVLVGYDLDDIQTIEIVPHLCELYPWLYCYGRDRGNSISRDYQNWLYKKCIGKFIFILNDDVEIKTPKWDEIAITKLNRFISTRPDGITYGWTNDSETMNRFGYEPSPYACFPILSRTAVDILGYTMHEYYGGWGADVHLYKVYKGVERIVNLSEIVVSHNTPWLYLRENDDTNLSMKDKSTNNDSIDPLPDINKLSKHIKVIPILL